MIRRRFRWQPCSPIFSKWSTQRRWTGKGRTGAGNTAAAGAAALLLSRLAQAMAERLRRSAKLVNLAHYPDFDDAFIDHLYLRPMQAD